MVYKFVFMSCLLAIAYGLFRPPDSVTLGPGVMVENAPAQLDIDTLDDTTQFGEYLITPLANFDIEAKVLAKKQYRFGRESDLSPVDLALGWGEMSDEAVLQHIEIDQANRWYYWRVESFPIPRRAIETQSANMHIIPANDFVEDSLDDARRGDIVKLSGKLVRIDADDGWRWTSSLSREDTGANACEVILVENFSVLSY